MLRITFKVNSERNFPSVSCSLPSSLSHLFPPSSSLRLPSWSSQTSLFDFVPLAQQLISSQMKNPQISKLFFESMKEKFGGVCVQYDNISYSTMSFSFFGNFPVVVVVELDESFPSTVPDIYFQAFINTREFPIARKLKRDKTPWSPKWTPSEMANNLFPYLFSLLPEFHLGCIKSNSN